MCYDCQHDTFCSSACVIHAHVTNAQVFVNECWDGYSVCYKVDYTTRKGMNASREKEYIRVPTSSYRVTYHDTVFENVTLVYKKKSPGQPARARVAGRSTPQFSRLGDSLPQYIHNESLAYKHKSNVTKNNTSLRVMTVDMTHFAAVCAPCARA